MEVFGTDPLRKFNNIAMRWYTSSDAWTRAVCYQAADDLLTVATKRLDAGKIDMDRFLKETKLNKFDKMDQRDVLKALNKEGVENAKMVYTEIMAHETMFPYKTAENPDVFHGLFGRLFGGFGHYPVYYTANMLRGLKNAGSLAGQIGFGLTVLGTTTALYTAFKDGLGVNASNFLWYTPMQFSGGPWYKIMNTALQANGTGYEADRARAELKNDIPRLMAPGSAALRSWKKAVEAASVGDYQTMILNGFSAPIVTKNF
jgi:hypothetical protein